MILKMESLTQASRAICYDNAIAIDLAQNHSDKKIREKYQLKADLLTPISKSWATNVGVEVSSLGIQVHGGMGYSRYKPFEHIYRHHRRYRITEGSEEIQIRKVAGHLFKFIKGKS